VTSLFASIGRVQLGLWASGWVARAFIWGRGRLRRRGWFGVCAARSIGLPFGLDAFVTPNPNLNKSNLSPYRLPRCFPVPCQRNRVGVTARRGAGRTCRAGPFVVVDRSPTPSSSRALRAHTNRRRRGATVASTSGVSKFQLLIDDDLGRIATDATVTGVS
jgi:hypothetical protein